MAKWMAAEFVNAFISFLVLCSSSTPRPPPLTTNGSSCATNALDGEKD